jgi:hypothetical protein
LDPAFDTALLTLSHAHANADDQQDVNAAASSIKLDEAKGTRNQPTGEDVDAIITNNKMRADTGSKSKYSISSSFGYDGGSLHAPLSIRRPNITNGTGANYYSALNGNIAGKYGITTQTAVLGGIGMRMSTPFQSGTPSGYIGNKFDVTNPYATIQHLYRYAGLQANLFLTETFFTNSDLVRQGYLSSWGFGQNNVYDIGHTGLSVGVNTYLGYAVYSKRDSRYTNDQSDYSWGFSPMLEYKLTDRMSLHTDNNLFIFEHLRSSPNGWTFQRQAVAQNFSVGYAIIRDFYLSPGVSFVWNDIRSDRTTWTLAASINWF